MGKNCPSRTHKSAAFAGHLDRVNGSHFVVYTFGDLAGGCARDLTQPFAKLLAKFSFSRLIICQLILDILSQVN